MRCHPKTYLRSLGKIFSLLLCIAVIYCEYISYSILPLQWFEKPVCNPPKCFKLLLVADPQIIGSDAPGKFLFSFIERWDSDKYLKKTFQQAVHFMEPDFIIFLGDLMDEGRISIDLDFLNDFERFLNIFKVPESVEKAKRIFIPGDNDIGGDEEGIMLPQVISRFDKKFNQSKGPVLLQTLEIYKLNMLTYTIQEPHTKNDNDDTIRVLISHMPMLPRVSQFVESVAKMVRPHLVLSGHEHVSTHVVAAESNIWRRNYIALGPNITDVKIFGLRQGVIHEITVPTCSYRMGVTDMGYGAAFIDTHDKLLYYYVLWLPKRFNQLFSYIYILAGLVLYLLSFLLFFLKRS